MSYLNKHYTFERFVVGPSNEFAHAAAIAVAEKPVKNFNPLLIYGATGLGKTHLLHAIGLKIHDSHHDLSVMYVSAKEFMNEMIDSIRYDRMPLFRDKYRNIGCMLIDDAHFLSGKVIIQEEFLHIFNAMHDSGKQVVIASEKFPRDIPNLEERLRSRFQWGLMAEIKLPEIETRIAIIKKKTEEKNILIPDNIVHYIASHVESNIGETEGFLTLIIAYSSFTKREINIDLVKEVLKMVKQIDLT